MRKEVIVAVASVVLAQTCFGQTSTTAASTASSAQTPKGPPTVCANDPERHRFDFWIGEWDVTTPDGNRPAAA